MRQTLLINLHPLLLNQLDTHQTFSNAARPTCSLAKHHLQITLFMKVDALQAAGHHVHSIACGGAVTAAVTVTGRVLVCGDEWCRGGREVARSSAWEFVDVGPDASWHGMARKEQMACGGGGVAASKVSYVP